MGATLAGRLGFGAQERVAIVHCDDIGMCHAANQGAFEALRRGPATCGSLMVPCPGFPEAAELARASPGLDLGVHSRSTPSGSATDGVRSPERGRCPRWSTTRGACRTPPAKPSSAPRPEHVELELRAQIECALAAGIDVTHLDAHMGTALFPPFGAIYAALARDYRLPVFAVRPDPVALRAAGVAGAGDFFAALAASLEAAGVPILDGFDANSLGFTPGEGEAHNRSRLRGLRPGVNYLICHPAQVGEELSAICPDAHARDFERGFYGGEAGERALAEEGIRTLGMRKLRDLMRSEP